ncbi:hypothetical protein ACWEN3_15565 [Streptomyces sp. NPDC004561]
MEQDRPYAAPGVLERAEERGPIAVDVQALPAQHVRHGQRDRVQGRPGAQEAGGTGEEVVEVVGEVPGSGIHTDMVPVGPAAGTPDFRPAARPAPWDDERTEGEVQRVLARKRKLIRDLNSPATQNTAEELIAALEDPDPGLLQQVQEQADRMQAQVLARKQEAAAAARRRLAGRLPTEAREPIAAPAHHDTARRHAHDQEQAAALQQSPGQGPSRT